MPREGTRTSCDKTQKPFSSWVSFFKSGKRIHPVDLAAGPGKTGLKAPFNLWCFLLSTARSQPYLRHLSAHMSHA